MKQKKLSFAILEILRQYTDAEHTLNQNDIVELLEREYEIKADRKSVKRNLTALWEMGFPIDFKETRRMYPNKDGVMEESFIQHDFYIDREFTDAELRLLIDSLLFSKHIPYSQCKELVEKLEGLSNRYFKSRVRHISTMPDTAPKNAQLFYTIEIIDEAISTGKQVAFTYNSFGLDKKLHPKRDWEYVVNPYQMAACNGRYYLIGNYNYFNDIGNYRLDRITDIRILDTPVKPMSQVNGGKHFNLPQHMAEHLYMFGGDSVPVTFRMQKSIINDVIDWFGADVTFSDETENDVVARVTVNKNAMRYWAQQYCRFVRILAPADLVSTVKEDLRKALEGYGG